MVENHTHSGWGWDGERINYNNLNNKPIDLSQSWEKILDIRVNNPSAWQTLQYNANWYWENI